MNSASVNQKRRRPGLLVAVLLGLAAGCGGSSAAPAACENIVSQSCARRSECTQGQMKLDDCTAMARKTINCAQPDLSCPSGKRYDVAAADKCLSDLTAASCDAILKGTVASCALVCK